MVIQLKKNIIPRDLANLILPAMPPKAVVIYGPRRAGKTTLVKSLLGPEAGSFDCSMQIELPMFVFFRDWSPVGTLMFF